MMSRSRARTILRAAKLLTTAMPLGVAVVLIRACNDICVCLDGSVSSYDPDNAICQEALHD